jgi:hypothetical protein
MNDFRSELKLHDHSTVDFPAYQTIPAGDYFMSIQAHDGAYCTPRETVPLETYTAFEVAIFDEGENWVIPPDTLAQFDWASRFETGETTSVAGWLSIETIERMRADLIALSTT